MILPKNIVNLGRTYPVAFQDYKYISPEHLSGQYISAEVLSGQYTSPDGLSGQYTCVFMKSSPFVVGALLSLLVNCQ